jgi:hypothetical protein
MKCKEEARKRITGKIILCGQKRRIKSSGGCKSPDEGYMEGCRFCQSLRYAQSSTTNVKSNQSLQMPPRVCSNVLFLYIMWVSCFMCHLQCGVCHGKTGCKGVIWSGRLVSAWDLDIICYGWIGLASGFLSSLYLRVSSTNVCCLTHSLIHLAVIK